MTTFESLTTAQKIRATLHRDVRTICTEACHLMGLEVTKPATEVIAELMYRKLLLYATDLEAFAKHAKRNTINSDDVKLLVRRNPSLKSHLNTIAPTNTSLPKEKAPKNSLFSKDKEDKRRETILTVKQPEAVASTSKVKQTPEKVESSAMVSGDGAIKENIENMAIDDTIDLTFD